MSEFQTVSESELQSVEGGWLFVLFFASFGILGGAATLYVEDKNGTDGTTEAK